MSEFKQELRKSRSTDLCDQVVSLHFFIDILHQKVSIRMLSYRYLPAREERGPRKDEAVTRRLHRQGRGSGRRRAAGITVVAALGLAAAACSSSPPASSGAGGRGARRGRPAPPPRQQRRRRPRDDQRRLRATRQLPEAAQGVARGRRAV